MSAVVKDAHFTMNSAAILKASASQIKDKDKEKLLSAVAEDAHFTKQSSETALHFKSKIYK